MPLGDLKVLEQPRLAEFEPVGCVAKLDGKVASKPVEKSPAAIQFVRNRMLYARPVLNSRGVVTFGLRHIRKWLLVECCGDFADEGRCVESLSISVQKQ